MKLRQRTSLARSRRTQYTVTGGPFSGKCLTLETPGTMEFSVMVDVGKEEVPVYKKFKGFYNREGIWVDTLKDTLEIEV